MVLRKRAREETEDSSTHVAKKSEPQPGHEEEHGLLYQLRNMWEFSNLVQYIYSFGKVVKISDDIDIDNLETECLKPGPSAKLLDIGLTLLKFVSSHRGLTSENFEEYTRRQYLAKAPARNPFGDAEEPIKFNDLDIFQRIRILQQLALWTFWNPDRMRERMPEQKETEQTQWRVDEIGYDRDERLYYVLDDNRLYRRTDPPIPAARPAKPKANSKKARAAARAAKKRKLSGIKDEEDKEPKNEANGGAEHDSSDHGYKWECIAITLAQYNAFLQTIKKSKDPNEEFLREQLVENVIPIIEKVEESQRRKRERREKELINMQRMANAKRSSRIASKQDRERQEMEAAEAARKREAERLAAIKEQAKQKKIEKERLYRMMTREQRLKDREEKRRLHEEELAKIAEEAKKIESGEARMSKRHLKAEMEKRKKDLEALQNEERWIFDCSGCGVHGENLDDGSHIVACEKCNIWQHIECLVIPKDEAEKEDFHFVCSDCKRRIEEANLPKIPPLKFRIGASSSPPSTGKPKANGEKRKRQNHSISHSVKKAKHPSTSPAKPSVPLPKSNISTNGFVVEISQGQRLLNPQTTSLSSQPTIPSSPQRQMQQPIHNGLYPLPPGPHPRSNIQQPNSSLAPSPFSLTNEASNALPRPNTQPPGPAPHFLHYQPPGLYPRSNSSSFTPQHVSASPSTKAGSFISPIRNLPSMSPTQGNQDVGPLAGFPPSSLPNGPLPATPRVHHQIPTHSAITSSPAYTAAQPSNPSRTSPSLSSTTSTPARNSFAYTSPSPSLPPTSGISPIKHTPAHPPLSSFTSSSTVTTPILPPVQRLHPSPKLMGRASPDSPIPPPVKNMTPDQEDRRRRENELAVAQGLNLSQSQRQHQYQYQISGTTPQVLDCVILPQPRVQQQQQQQQQHAFGTTLVQPTQKSNNNQ
ncbi:hypothetical protein PABG_00538 [Paracoccidioides brasiliensis Pb03]|nr:hypothetical protein PABG_00538 [Paracoccidioides brasiliensis Pb03]